MKTFSYLIALVFTGMTSAAIAEISLPEGERDLGVTQDVALGTRADDIGLAEGQSVPPFSARSHLGADVSSAELLPKGPLLVIFYRGGWCPYCNVQIRQMTQAWSEFERRGVLPVLISVDKPDAAALAQRTYEIPFPVLSDSDLSAHTAFDVVMTLDDATQSRYRKGGLELQAWSGRDDGKIAVASAFLVDTDGRVAWSHADTDFKTRPSVSQLLAVIDEKL